MSEWKQGAAARRDARATKSDAAPASRSRKNTRRWCKGVPGREHQLAVERDPRWAFDQTCQRNSWWPCRHREICTVCGKVLRWHLPVEECPELNA